MGYPRIAIKETRIIDSIFFPYEDSYRVGSNGVTAIKPYYEVLDSEPYTQVWVAVYQGNEIFARVNMKYVETIVYQTT